MTFNQFLTKAGLWLPHETPAEKLQQLKKLTQADRQWFAERAKIEMGIEVELSK